MLLRLMLQSSRLTARCLPPYASRLTLLVLSATVMLAASVACIAQEYPSRPIRMISPYPPGGGNDTLSRLLGEKLFERLGQRVVVDNRPGANTIVGTEMLAKAAPDGHTLIILPNSFVTNPSFYHTLPYDSVRDFAPVGLLAISPQMWVAHPTLGVKTVKELIALAKAKPRYYAYASSGNGSTGHLAGVLFNMMTGTELIHVAYKGTAPAVTELLGGHVPLMMSSMLATLPHVRAGKLNILAVTTSKRCAAIPEVPTMAEAGVPGYEATLWYGMLAPGRTPPAIIRRLNAELGKIMEQPDLIEKLSSQGVEPYFSTPEAFTARIRDEIPKWAKVAAAAGAAGN